MLNRRQAIAAAFGFAASAGLPKPASMADQIADVFGIPRQMLPPVPILYGHVDSFWFDESLPTEAVESMRKCWDGLRKISPDLPPCVVLDSGLRLEMVDAVPPVLRS